ncbi:hypothetical protein MHZ92_04680 [Sporosarcina sp. ACRSL]|uniref:hypothetical protein n=1 Tax=Sporosarcina sp. ACRSL TaxID=2918215 RepID=UPI001EF713B4|nr:hypothetical protein [Sporosarcina sp. ACRSL]MCG7343414.1 hypothetical protein [Sporosarcina sp. ACRSL]
MGKIFSRKLVSIVVAGLLLFSAGGAVVSAKSKEGKKQTNRTEQNHRTDVITYNEVTVPRYAKEVRLTGTVVIDGPQLVVSIPGSKNMTVTKVRDKVWTYEAVVDVSSIKGDAVYEISAYTVFVDKRNAGKVHSSARTVSQKIHVPFITSTVAENTKWEYNRSINQFTLTYDIVENWSNGEKVNIAKSRSYTVRGVDNYVAVPGTATTLSVPTANQDFTFSPEATWKYDATTKRYSATFNILITDSKGNVRKEAVTINGLMPGQVNEISYPLTDRYGTVTKKAYYTAPAAPVDVVVDRLQNLTFTLVQQNKNQFKVAASYQLVHSDGRIEAKIHYLDGNFGNPASKSKNSSSRNWEVAGFVYKITVNYDAKNKIYYVTYEDVSKK